MIGNNMKKRVKKVRKSVPRSISRLYPNVKFVEESDKYIEVFVSKKDCVDAKEMDPTGCALARAVKKEFHVDAAIIGLSSSYIIKGNKAIRFLIPRSTRQEIVFFDRHHDFEPGKYLLNPISAAKKLGRHSNSSRKETTNHKPKREYHKTSRVRQLPHGYDSE